MTTRAGRKGRVLVAVLLVLLGAPVVLLAIYELRNAGTVVRLQPAWADNERVPLEIGDTLAVATGDLLFPGVFGNYYVTGLRPWHFRLRSLDPTGTVKGGAIVATAAGALSIEAGYRRPIPIGKPHRRTFFVLREPIDTIAVHLSRDTLAVGDTLIYRVEVRGRSGRIWDGDLPMAAPPIIDLESYGTRQEWTGRGRALSAGLGMIVVRAGHHRTAVPIVVVSGDGDDPAGR